MSLFDTSKIIEMLRENQFKTGYISVITLIEILRGVKENKRSKVKELLETVFDVLPIDNDVILEYCILYQKLKERGQLVSDADLLIAATAKSRNLTVITNDKDSLRLKNLGVKVKNN